MRDSPQVSPHRRTRVLDAAARGLPGGAGASAFVAVRWAFPSRLGETRLTAMASGSILLSLGAR